MRVSIRRVALIAAAVAGVAGCAPAAIAAPASVPSWHIVKQVHNGPMGDFTAVTAVGRTGGWAFNWGSVPTAWRLSGSTWTQVPFPGLANERVVAAGAVSPSDVWAFTSNGTQSRALRWNGSTWAVEHTFSRAIAGAAVLGASDVWVFGDPVFPGQGLGAWHYNGHTWSQPASGHGLEGGSGLSAGDIWAFDGADVAHWNGSTWSRTSLASLLPAKQQLNDPALTGIYEQSPHSVYAIGNGRAQDEGGPLVILHWNGSAWSRVAQGNYGIGTLPVQQVGPDGHGGFWLPMPGYSSTKAYMLHYSAGQLTAVGLPGGPYRISVDAVALIPGTTDLL
ncbi:MAG TPA: hypothetical protein VIX15_17870, partial [Streptosporangiaceae bacterium]